MENFNKSFLNISTQPKKEELEEFFTSIAAVASIEVFTKQQNND